MPLPILIKFPDENDPHFTIAQGDKYHEGLSWGEMLEQVIGLTHSQIQQPRLPMKSKRLQAAEREFMQASHALRKVQESEYQEIVTNAFGSMETQPSPVAEPAAKEAVRLGQMEE